ncbi:MAG: hypothetical protein WDO70_08985 [Alphaproteobacteria bacterium]
MMNDFIHIFDVRSEQNKKLAEYLYEFETPGQACEDRKKRIRQLRNYGGSAGEELADRIEDCHWGFSVNSHKHAPCASLACSVCARAYRLWLAGRARILLKPYKKHQLQWVTIIPKKGVPYHTLRKFDHTRLKRSIQRILRESIPSNVVVVGGMDFNIDDRGEKTLWQPHIHIIVVGEDREMDKLRKHYQGKKTCTGSSQCKIVSVYKRKKLLTYIFKNDFIRKEKSPTEEDQENKLRVGELCELLLYLDSMSFDDRLITRNLSRRKDKLVYKSY